jgi:hypothetical protein
VFFLLQTLHIQPIIFNLSIRSAPAGAHPDQLAPPVLPAFGAIFDLFSTLTPKLAPAKNRARSGN